MFVHLCELDDSKYFMCQMGDFKFLASMIQHVPLDIKVRYTFCCAPISMKHTFACTMFLKVSRSFVFILIASSGFASVSMMAGCCRKILEWFLGKMTSVKYHDFVVMVMMIQTTLMYLISRQFARRFSEGHPLTLTWVTHHLGFPFEVPKNLRELALLENVFDVIDLYLWLRWSNC